MVEKNNNEIHIDKGVKFVYDQIQKTLELVELEEYKDIKLKVIKEFNYVRSMKHTGNLYEYYSKFNDGKHKFAEKFKSLEEHGIITNEKMADYLKKNFREELNNFCSIEDLKINEIYTNNEIASTFKCSYMGGMRKSNKTNSLVLIANHLNLLYDDQWDEDGRINYTGMGRYGDQNITFRQNKTLATAEQNGIKIYLFESYKENEYYYCGQVKLCDEIFIDNELDINGEMRKVIKFPLKSLEENTSFRINKDSFQNSIDTKKKLIENIDNEKLKKMASKRKLNKQEKVVIAIEKERNQYVSLYTKRRAAGFCDLCGEKAPFNNKKGEPYLESHHVKTLANDGPDVIYNTVALCPNCHRKMHVVNNKNDLKKLIKKLYKYIKEEHSEDMNEFKNLFDNINWSI